MTAWPSSSSSSLSSPSPACSSTSVPAWSTTLTSTSMASSPSRRRRSRRGVEMLTTTTWPRRLLLVAGLTLSSLHLSRAEPRDRRLQDLSQVCEHQTYDQVAASVEISEGETVYDKISKNQTHRYFFRSYNTTTMNQADQYRKLIINLEPCKGVVYLFVRKTRQCYPNPYSCITGLGTELEKRGTDCEWTSFRSEIDRSKDGTPTFFEVPLSSTKYYLSIYATESSAYTLTVLADIGAFPRPGAAGKIEASQLRELQVQLSWSPASFIPTGISNVKKYWVYSSMLLDNDDRSNMAVFLRPDKIMNTVCGLTNNTDREYTTVLPSSCGTTCNVTVDGVITDKRYVFNVIVESARGYKMAYAGLIMKTDWEVVRQATSDKTLKVIGAVSGSVLGMVVIIYFLMLKLYG